MCDTKIETFVQHALQHHDINDYKIEVEGSTGKGDNYLGDITFIKVSGSTATGDGKVINLTIKSSMENQGLCEVIPMRQLFLKEILVYDTVLVAFQKLLKEKHINKLVDFIPYCYTSCPDQNNEFIVLENLKTQGFQLCNKAVAWDFDHTRLVLEAYGFWHALSLALKVQKPEYYKEITRDNVNMFGYFFNKTKLDILTARRFKEAKEMVIRDDERDLLKHLEFSKDDVRYAFGGLDLEDPDYQVITHGDCWNNNFMFNYLDDDLKPISVRILDWQCSGLSSPVFDLAYFIYCCCDTGRYPDPQLFLNVYYNTLSKNLRLLGCDPDKVFPFEKLIEHWKRFSHFGMFLGCMVVRLCLVKTEHTPEFGDFIGKGEEAMETVEHYLEDETEYVRRARNNFMYYYESIRL